MMLTSESERQLEVTAQNSPPGLCLRGEVDLFTVPELEVALETVLAAPGDVTIDLHQLTFIDVLGSRALARAAIQLRRGGRRMRLRGASMQLRRMLHVLGWARLFEFPLLDDVARPAQRAVAVRLRQRPEHVRAA
ncbi:STAS domain-containing protein [Micromonospora endophytica]|nr:STAS domain-containing protein [Micromonospora endophytica]BCJ61771.1 hypothetical protein Jiend_51930 [Micromonospora endophytica]